MKNPILSLAGVFLFGASVPAATLSDHAGLKLALEDNGNIAGVELSGEKLPNGTASGFYLQEPNSPKKVAIVGTAASKDGKLHLTLTSPLQANVSAVLTEGQGFIEVVGVLEDLTGKDRGLWLGFNLPVTTTGWKWGQSLSTSPVITNEYPAYAESNNLVPIPAVWTSRGGIALCIPPTDPCVFEVGADADGIRIQMAFGLSKDTIKFPSKAPFRFRIYSIDGTWGFRDALAKYYDWYPDYYRIEPKVMTALGHHHDWINMNYVSETFKTDRQIDPTVKEYLAYTKTSARIQGLENAKRLKTNKQFLDAIAKTTTIQHYEKKGAANSPLLTEGRAALINSICYNPDGSFGRYKTSDDGVDFPHNCDPDLFADRNLPVYANMYLRKGADLRKVGNFIGIHWDRLGGWSNFLNYRRDHFAYLDHPLTFDQEGRPCIQTQFTNYELFDAYRLLLQKGGLYHEAAGMKEFGWGKIPNKPAGQERTGMFFLAAVVAGGWHEGSFKPIELGGFDFERMVVGRKSYRISSGNIPEHKESPTLDVIKNALARTTAYGFAWPVQVQYFYPPAHPGYLKDYSWYTKPEHKALWDKYEPANLAIRLAGWEPVTCAHVNSPAVQLQRFGRGRNIYLTVWGPTPPASVDIEVDAAKLGLKETPSFSEMVANTPMKVTKSPKGWKLTVPMEKNMTRVIKIN
ncbi:MAG: hypothetical protein NTY19_18055 [Planctomycetota bacterium]|nr:hypothetical protein [Planctomycetota bacterium]